MLHWINRNYMSLQVYKFGGASVKNATGVRNLVEIVRRNTDKQLLIVVSAMGKTTNSLEKLTFAYINGENTSALFDEIKAAHEEILSDLFTTGHPIFDDVANAFVEIEWILEEEPHDDIDFIYDQVVSIGELVSSRIVQAALADAGLPCRWVDARSFIHTDNTYREGQVDWKKTGTAIRERLLPAMEKSLLVSQGFIGGTSENYTTTLGREGSDYSAAIFASCLPADALTIWKDVPGVLNADPKRYPDAKKYDHLPYAEALEMTYYGATVIHPKTIKPLQNAGIPLYVKPFYDASLPGTQIGGPAEISPLYPAVIVKDDQCLLSVSAKDFSFITEEHLSDIFSQLSASRIKVNTMQMSAISFSVCFDYRAREFSNLVPKLESRFNIRYNLGLTLVTIRHYEKELLTQLTEGKTVLLEQLSRNTAQLVIKERD